MADKPSTWTAERRARQAMLIHTWQPWKKSTGRKSLAAWSERKARSKNFGPGPYWPCGR